MQAVSVQRSTRAQINPEKWSCYGLHIIGLVDISVEWKEKLEVAWDWSGDTTPGGWVMEGSQTHNLTVEHETIR